ncbi:unnamed protein product [Umbelopsis ramanniana]
MTISIRPTLSQRIIWFSRFNPSLFRDLGHKSVLVYTIATVQNQVRDCLPGESQIICNTWYSLQRGLSCILDVCLVVFLLWGLPASDMSQAASRLKRTLASDSERLSASADTVPEVDLNNASSQTEPSFLFAPSDNSSSSGTQAPSWFTSVMSAATFPW